MGIPFVCAGRYSLGRRTSGRGNGGCGTAPGWSSPTIGQAAGTVAVLLAGGSDGMFYHLRSQIFAEFVENTENFY